MKSAYRHIIEYKLFYRFHKWYDNLKEPKRFLFFLFGIGLPFIINLNLVAMYPNKYTITSLIIFMLLISTRITHLK